MGRPMNVNYYFSGGDPCKDCTKREPKCHSKCEDYISYKKKHIEELKAKKEAKRKEYIAISKQIINSRAYEV